MILHLLEFCLIISKFWLFRQESTSQLLSVFVDLLLHGLISCTLVSLGIEGGLFLSEVLLIATIGRSILVDLLLILFSGFTEHFFLSLRIYCLLSPIFFFLLSLDSFSCFFSTICAVYYCLRKPLRTISYFTKMALS